MAKQRHTRLPPPYLKRIWLDDNVDRDRGVYPFSLPLFDRDGFELRFDRPITITARTSRQSSRPVTAP